MARYIDADALEVVCFTDREGSFSDGVQWLLEYIDGLPSAQPEIIRCKDCYHYPSEYADCPMIGWARNENDFCSKAERRTDE